MKNNSSTIFLVAVILLVAQNVISAPVPMPPGGPIPIDGGLSLLIAGGIGYAVKTAYNKKNKN